MNKVSLNMAISNFHFWSFLFLANFLVPIHCHGHFGHSNKHTALFIFGDSLFDSGNNNYINTTTDFQANFKPYGETFFKYPTGRFSDGRIIPDFIAEYANLPLIKPYLQPGNHQFDYGANFASAGAGALDETFPGLVINLKTQLRNFENVEKVLRQKFGDKEAKKILLNAVYLFSFGSNDYWIPLMSTNSTQKQFVEMVIGNFTAAIKVINGGRLCYTKMVLVYIHHCSCIENICSVIENICSTKTTGTKVSDHGTNIFIQEQKFSIKNHFGVYTPIPAWCIAEFS